MLEDTDNFTDDDQTQSEISDQDKPLLEKLLLSSDGETPHETKKCRRIVIDSSSDESLP